MEADTDALLDPAQAAFDQDNVQDSIADLEKHTVAGLEYQGWFMGGIINDYRRRLPFYRTDITDGFKFKTISAALYMFFATGASTIALAEIVKTNTEGHIGMAEFLFANSLAGVLHALVGCQPLLVLRPTGPITAFLTLIFKLSKTLEVEFEPFLAYVGIFVGVYMILIAAFELNRYIRVMTRFTHDIFAFFVCTIYIHDGINGAVSRFDVPDDEFVNALFSLCMTLVVFFVALGLNGMGTSQLFSHSIRKLIVDYALTIGMFCCIGISYLVPAAKVTVARIDMPDNFSPTLPGRSWMPNLAAEPWWLPLAGMASAIPIVAFFYFDQNVSSLLCQTPNMHLKKGSYFHSSFFLMGVFNIIFPLFGMPFVTGSLPHSPQFVDAETEALEDGRVFVWENRIAPLLMYLAIGVPLLYPDMIQVIPLAAVDGILIFVGVAGLLGLQLFARLGLLVTHSSSFPISNYALVRPWKMRMWTLTQVAILGVAWAVQLSPAGLIFPLIIVLLIPFRERVLTRVYTAKELSLLDAHEEEEPTAPLIRDDPKERGLAHSTQFDLADQEEVERRRSRRTSNEEQYRSRRSSAAYTY